MQDGNPFLFHPGEDVVGGGCPSSRTGKASHRSSTGKKISRRTGSKERLVSWATRSSGLMPKVSRCQATKMAQALMRPQYAFGDARSPGSKEKIGRIIDVDVRQRRRRCGFSGGYGKTLRVDFQAARGRIRMILERFFLRAFLFSASARTARRPPGS